MRDKSTKCSRHDRGRKASIIGWIKLSKIAYNRSCIYIKHMYDTIYFFFFLELLFLFPFSFSLIFSLVFLESHIGLIQEFLLSYIYLFTLLFWTTVWGLVLPQSLFSSSPLYFSLFCILASLFWISGTKSYFFNFGKSNNKVNVK